MGAGICCAVGLQAGEAEGNGTNLDEMWEKDLVFT